MKKYHWINLPEDLSDMSEYTFVVDPKNSERGVGTLTFQVQFYRYLEINEYIWADDVQTQIFFEVDSVLNQDSLLDPVTAGNITAECTDKYVFYYMHGLYTSCLWNETYHCIRQGS